MEIKIGDKVKTNDEYFKTFKSEVEGIVKSINRTKPCGHGKNRRCSFAVIKIEISDGEFRDIGEGWLIKIQE